MCFAAGDEGAAVYFAVGDEGTTVYFAAGDEGAAVCFAAGNEASLCVIMLWIRHSCVFCCWG